MKSLKKNVSFEDEDTPSMPVCGISVAPEKSLKLRVSFQDEDGGNVTRSKTTPSKIYSSQKTEVAEKIAMQNDRASHKVRTLQYRTRTRERKEIENDMAKEDES